MLDDLLGRTALRERIEELEEELHHTERELAAERERRREATTARQDAEERVNRLEDRIADLEGRLEATGGEADDLGFRREERLRGARLESVLSRLTSFDAGAEGVLTAMVDGDVPEPLADLLGDRVPLVRRTEPCLAVADDAGVLAVALDPPVTPGPFVEWDEAPRLDRSWFLPTGEHAVGLVRADLFGLGRFEGEERVGFEGFESDVKGDHSKGGFSQGRFERIRDGQIDDHIERCREALGAVEGPLYLTGERVVLSELEDLATVTRPVDATGEPESALDDAVRDFWTTACYGL
ncbi:MAG: Vms1/Ankzf1 family peptidyl-tRNA hydrolase [Haloarculaceae archaeon]